MKQLSILMGTLFLCAFSSAQTLSDSQVLAAINRALSGKHHQIGLTLNDVQTNLLSGLACSTCKTSGYTIFVYTPGSWIELQALQARREMLPFGLQDVTFEMRLPYIHILASPSRPEYLNANGMGMASSVHRVVLSSTDRSDVIQPLSESHAEVDSNSALRSFTQASAGAVFSLRDVERLRSEDPKREFFIVVVGDNKNKDFKVKDRFFKQLFGQPSDTGYAEIEHDIAGDMPIKKPATENEDKTTAEAQTPKQPSGSTKTRQPDRGEYRQASQEGLSDPSVPASPAVSAVLTKPNADTGSGAINDQSVKTDSIAPATRSSVPAGTEAGNVAPGHYEALLHDNDLIASWWNLREPNPSGPSHMAHSQSGTNSASSADSQAAGEGGSIGAWSDEKRRIRHDGVRVDRIASDDLPIRLDYKQGTIFLRSMVSMCSLLKN
jgi:hypothetical protein